MPMPRKKDPIKNCMHCGARLERKFFSNGRLEDMGVFMRRKYCAKKCNIEAQKLKPHKKNPQWMTAHYHARNKKPQSDCEACGASKKTDVHHLNLNWRDNSQENLVRLCRSCHIKIHRSNLRELRKHFPELWQKMCGWEMDCEARCPSMNRGFHYYEAVHDLEKRFAKDEVNHE